MALDLGGTNFRVLVIDIDGDDLESFKMENEIFASKPWQNEYILYNFL